MTLAQIASRSAKVNKGFLTDQLIGLALGSCQARGARLTGAAIQWMTGLPLAHLFKMRLIIYVLLVLALEAAHLENAQDLSESQLLLCSTGSSDSQDCPQDVPTQRSEAGSKERVSEVASKRDCSGKDTNSIPTLTCEPTVDRPLKVFVYAPDFNSSLESIGIAVGSEVKLQCTVELSSALQGQNLRSNLRWFRSTSGSRANQSIPETSSKQPGFAKAGNLISNEIVNFRVHATKRNDALDLTIDGFKAEDVGDYFCQATTDSGQILDDSRTQLYLVESPIKDRDRDLPYSQENLFKLLPSLRVIPEFSEVQLGERVQLACIAGHQDVDPDPAQISWSFGSLETGRNKLLQDGVNFVSDLPEDTTALGNVLVIWSFAKHHCGLYRCLVELADFHLKAQATGELALKAETSDSAPIVVVNPALLRLSLDGSATIQCEASGYPPPELIWYRVDGAPKITGMALEEEGLMIESIRHQDTMAFCHENRCYQQLSGVASISLLRISDAKLSNQGQFACRADNKHGSNQASSIVDVELREPPRILINNTKLSEQLIVLDIDEVVNVSFVCTVESGEPVPHLRWLRKVKSSPDVYDLDHMSSATSDVSLSLADDRRALTLTMAISSSDDEGDYVCLAENEWGKDSAIGRLAVARPIRVRISQTSPFQAQPHQSFQLDCRVTGHPLPVELEWSRSDRGVFFSLIGTANQLHSRGAHERSAVLKFDQVTGDDSGEYTCSARDQLNSSLVVRDTIMVVVERSEKIDQALDQRQVSQMPRLMVRPTKVNAQAGSNVTLDCLAIAGLQPILVEWIVASSASLTANDTTNRRMNSLSLLTDTNHITQFGSKLRIVNVSRAHEGVYHCKGSNKFGIENAPALIRLIDEPLVGSDQSKLGAESESKGDDKTKVAKAGSNIELKCQVSGTEQLATSWSRDGLELPTGSVQLGHNLWLRNVSTHDNGLYVCLARSAQPNKVIQARVKLLVQAGEERSIERHQLRAKIVPSRNSFNVGDSVTLECIVGSAKDDLHDPQLDELERNVIWTNLHSGQTLFQDNVYIQENLLIIYGLRTENSATYRCNYNELSQQVDFKLVVSAPDGDQSLDPLAAKGDRVPADQSLLVSSSGRRAVLRQMAIGAKLLLQCPVRSEDSKLVYWTRGNKSTELANPLQLNQLRTSDADLYQCFDRRSNSSSPLTSVLVHVLKPAASFPQRPVSFITLPTIAGADHKLTIELKFYPEHEHGLVLFSGQSGRLDRSGVGDYIVLGLNRSHLEFRFELGDGMTLLRSLQPVSLNQWHRALIERNRRGATMWLDRQPAVSNSSPGKFFNLNLIDSVLYVGGHEHFLPTAHKSSARAGRQFQGYSSGFQGCISHLRVGSNELQLMVQNRSVAVGVYECEQPECRAADCNSPDGICQLDWPVSVGSFSVRAQEVRCICMPGQGGERCDTRLPVDAPDGDPKQGKSHVPTPTTVRSPLGPCDSAGSPCSPEGSLNCQPLTSSSYKCHCKIGFAGDTCAEPIEFASNTSVLFRPHAYIQLRFNKPEEARAILDKQAGSSQATSFNVSQFARLTSMAEHQEIALKLLTNSSFGLILLTGSVAEGGTEVRLPANHPQTSKSMFVNLLSRVTTGDYLAISLIDGHLELR